MSSGKGYLFIIGKLLTICPRLRNAVLTLIIFSELTDIVNKLWKLDRNRLNPGEDFSLSFQGNASTTSAEDFAQKPLFKSVDNRFFRKPTYKGRYRM